ncbi:MAG: GTPase [Paracoccaceae bacterium]
MMHDDDLIAEEHGEAARPERPQRKPRVALMGEFSAGKSTLSNMLMGESPFPVKVTATRLPPVWASFGPAAAVAVDHDGVERPLDLGDLSSVTLENTALIRLSRETDILELCDLIDMPGVSDPNMPADVWLKLIDEIDFVIWCTHANQAWRQSEAAIWERIMDRTNGGNILLVTQIDKIRNDRDRARVLSRVRKETQGLFEAVYPVSLIEALNAGDDFKAEQEAGTAAFIEHLVDVLVRPLQAKPQGAVEWDVVPELPRIEAGAQRGAARVVTVQPARAPSERPEPEVATAPRPEAASRPDHPGEAAVVRPARVPRNGEGGSGITPRRVRPARPPEATL